MEKQQLQLSHAFEGMKDLFDILHEAKEDQEFGFKILRNGLDGTKKTMISIVETYLSSYITDNKVFKTIISSAKILIKPKVKMNPFQYMRLNRADQLIIKRLQWS